MPAERLSMRKLRDALRLHFELGLSSRGIAKSCQASASTVGGYLLRAKVAGLIWPLPPEMDDEALEWLLFPAERHPVRSRPEPDFGAIHLELRRKHVTLQLLWEEYRGAHPDGYEYSRYCDLYRRWAAKLNPTMRQTHRAGEKTFVDFSGDGLTIADPLTGECQTAPLFVAVLGASNLTWAEPVLDETLSTWLGLPRARLRLLRRRHRDRRAGQPEDRGDADEPLRARGQPDLRRAGRGTTGWR